MAKMPTNKILNYKAGTISSQTWTNPGSLNLVRDLAAINRHNVTHTNSKGVPYVFRCLITIKPTVDAESYNSVFDEDTNMIQILNVATVPQTWVARNAGVKMHFARENMFAAQGIRKKERGSYSKTIRLYLGRYPRYFLDSS